MGASNDMIGIVAGIAKSVPGSAAEAAVEAQQAAEAAAAEAQEILESIPEDYSELSADVSDLRRNLSSVQSNMPTAGERQFVNAETAQIINARVTDSTSTLVTDNNYKAVIVPANIESQKTYWAKVFADSVTVSEIKLYTFNTVVAGESVAVNVANSYGAVSKQSRVQTTATASYFVLVLRITSGTVEDALNGAVIALTADAPTEYQPYYIPVDDAILSAVAFTPDSVAVGTDSNYYQYTDINGAVVANPNSIIDVSYGTYETEVQGLTSNKKIIGKDPDLCVLTGTNKDYDTPPIEIAGGIIKNFTVRMTNNLSASHMGYCLHSDNAACANNTLIVENCKFDCTGQHAVGIGIYPGETVVYRNCEFVFLDEEAEPTHAPFFAHNSGDSDGVATVRFENCIFRGSSYAIKLSAYSSNCTMKFEFIGCTCQSETLTGDEMVWTDYVTGSTHDQTKLHVFTGKMILLGTSHGNNIDVLNSN